MKIDPQKLELRGYDVLIRQDEVKEKHGSILLSDETKQADEYATMTGAIVKVGELAFTFGTPGTETFWDKGTRPKIGSSVIYRKYAGGQLVEDEEGRKYRFVKDDDILAGLKDD